MEHPIVMIFNSNSFTFAWAIVRALKNKFDLICYTRKDTVIKPYLIYVKGDSWINFVNLIEPYFIPHFKYKLKLRGSYKTKTTKTTNSSV